MIDGYCHPDFKELENHFRSLIYSGYETGASFAVEKDGEMIVDLWGGFKDKEKNYTLGETYYMQCFLSHKRNYCPLHDAFS
jgi:hypothetical protein